MVFCFNVHCGQKSDFKSSHLEVPHETSGSENLLGRVVDHPLPEIVIWYIYIIFTK